MNLRIIFLGLMVFVVFRLIQLSSGVGLFWKVLFWGCGMVLMVFLAFCLGIFRNVGQREFEEEDGEYFIVIVEEELKLPLKLPLRWRIYLKMRKILHM